MEKQLEVLPGGVKHLGNSGIVKQRIQRIGIVDRQRIDHRDQAVIAGHLYQAQFGVIGVHPFKFRIHRQPFATAPLIANFRQ